MPYKGKPKLNVPAPVTAAEKRVIGLRRRVQPQFAWPLVDEEAIKMALLAVCMDGSAIMFSPAAGGRGVCLKLFVDGDKVTEYATDAEELEQLLYQVAEQLCPVGVDLQKLYDALPRTTITASDLSRYGDVPGNPSAFLGGKPGLFAKAEPQPAHEAPETVTEPSETP
jgi:hypothetical protein